MGKLELRIIELLGLFVGKPRYEAPEITETFPFGVPWKIMDIRDHVLVQYLHRNWANQPATQENGMQEPITAVGDTSIMPVIKHITAKIIDDRRKLELLLHDEGVRNFEEQNRLLREHQAGVVALDILTGLKRHDASELVEKSEPVSDSPRLFEFKVDLDKLEADIAAHDLSPVDDGKKPALPLVDGHESLSLDRDTGTWLENAPTRPEPSQAFKT